MVPPVRCEYGGKAGSPEVVDHAGHAEEGQDEGAGPPVALPDQVAARRPGLPQPLLRNGPVQLPMIPPAGGRPLRQPITRLSTSTCYRFRAAETYTCKTNLLLVVKYQFKTTQPLVEGKTTDNPLIHTADY